MRIVVALCFICLTGLQAKVLDRVVGVFNSEIITQSQIDRIIKTSDIRKQISPKIYKNSSGNKEVLDLMIRSFMIRDNLQEIGYLINDEQVEMQIKATEKHFKIGREELKKYFESHGITFEEYFELMRVDMEFNIFTERVINPSISITEQEVKNYFYKKNSDNNTLAFKYSLASFAISAKKIPKSYLPKMKEALKTFQISGVLPPELKDIETSSLGEIVEDGISKELAKLLKATEEGNFTDPILLSDNYHVFFVQQKDLVESEVFQKAKNQIRNEIFQVRAESVLDMWQKRMQYKYYIKLFL
jgi:peptidyl-prolyl cis-trans isomerase SurA